MKSTLATLAMGVIVGHYGVTGNSPDSSGVQAATEKEAVVALVEVPAVGANVRPPGMVSPRPSIERDIEYGVRHLDNGVRQLPQYMVDTSSKVAEHGIAALAYEDPELKARSHEIGREIGAGIRSLANALAKDMVATARGQTN